MSEYVLVVSLVAVAALSGFAALGDATSTKVDCVAGAIGGRGGPCEVSATAGEGAATTGPSAGASRQALSTGNPRWDSEFGMLDSEFDTFSGGDGKITEQDLRRAARSSNPAVARTASNLLNDDSFRNALDVGAGHGEVDGTISREDLDAAREALLGGEDVREMIADSANGRGGRDGTTTRSDLEALASDMSVPRDIRAWASARIREGRYDRKRSWLDRRVDGVKSAFMGGVHEVADAGGGFFKGAWQELVGAAGAYVPVITFVVAGGWVEPVFDGVAYVGRDPLGALRGAALGVGRIGADMVVSYAHDFVGCTRGDAKACGRFAVTTALVAFPTVGAVARIAMVARAGMSIRLTGSVWDAYVNGVWKFFESVPSIADAVHRAHDGEALRRGGDAYAAGKAAGQLGAPPLRQMTRATP